MFPFFCYTQVMAFLVAFTVEAETMSQPLNAWKNVIPSRSNSGDHIMNWNPSGLCSNTKYNPHFLKAKLHKRLGNIDCNDHNICIICFLAQLHVLHARTYGCQPLRGYITLGTEPQDDKDAHTPKKRSASLKKSCCDQIKRQRPL